MMRHTTSRRLAPALTLFLVTPLIAEYLLGSLSLAQIGALPVMCLMYGGGAVLIRELARSTEGGWSGIAVLGVAYAILEEGLATQSLFNPHYLHLRLLDYGFIPAMGIGASWTLYVLSLHVIWSVCVPIAIVEALYPESGATPWLGLGGRVAFGVLMSLGILVVAGYTHRTEQFVASPAQLATSGALAAMVGWLGLRGGRWGTAIPTRAGLAPSPWLVGTIAVLGGSAFEVAEISRSRGVPWPVPVAIRLAILVVAALQIRRASARSGWSAVHRFALGAAGVLVYSWWGFGVELSLHGTSGLVAHGVLAALAIALVAAAGLRVRAASGHSVAPSQRATLAVVYAEATAPGMP